MNDRTDRMVEMPASARAAHCNGSAEPSLKISDAQWRALIESALDGVLLSEPEGRIFAANPAACRLLGRSAPELRSLTRLDLFRRDDPRLPVLIAQREREGYYRGELTIVRADGTGFEAEVSSVVFLTPQGKIVSLIFRDVSERKTTEARAREQAQWLDKASEAIFVTDLDHRVTYWNQGAERMIGWPASEMIGKTIVELLASIGVFDPQVVAAGNELTDWWGTLRCRHRDGSTIIVASSATILRNDSGRATGRLCICTDITEQTLLREKYERALRLQSIGMLAAGLAHDVNNILTPIRLAVPMLRPRLQQAEDLQLLETIQTCVARGAAVVQQILGFSSGTGAEARLIDLRPVVREVASIVRETFPRAIALEKELPAELWPVMANPTQIHQLLLNLCVNARDAMPDGGRLRIGARNRMLDEAEAARIEGGRKGSHVEIFVEDSGTGIAPELLARVWEPFFTTKPAGAGTGLGLATVRSIVESHAGFITVQTALNCGTSFRVYLPAVVSAHATVVSPQASALSEGRGERILVVDDESIVREVAQALLTRFGYEVSLAADGAEALALVQAQPERFDLVLTDIDMPRLDGAGLARALARVRPSLKVMAMSGLGSGASRAKGGQFSAGLLAKPFSAELLLDAVSRAFDGMADQPAEAAHGAR